MITPAKRKINTAMDVTIFNIFGYIIISVQAVLCLLPFLLTISGSLTDDKTLLMDGYRLIPENLSFAAYRVILKKPVVISNAYFITIALVAIGTSLSTFLTSMTAYVLHRKDFKYRYFFSFFFFFTTLFSGGLIPWYVLMLSLGMKNSFFALLLPPMFSVFNIIVMRTFFTSIPESIGESAKIDGANDLAIFVKMYIPMALPGLATIGLFTALSYWNDWYNAMLFISKPHLIPLQYYLYKIFNDFDTMILISQKTGMPVPAMPKETFKLAMTVVVTGPIVLLFPFIQRYFIKGLTIGAVKG